MAKLNLGKVVGSDAEVTSQNIENALGYKPASQEDLESIDVSEDIENHNTDENAHEDIRGNIDEVSSQLNETATEVNNRVKKDGDILNGTYSINKKYFPKFTMESNTSNIIKTKITTSTPGNLTMRLVGRMHVPGSSEVIDLIFTLNLLKNTFRTYGKAYSPTTFKPELKTAFDNDGFLLIDIGGDIKSSLCVEVVIANNDDDTSINVFENWVIVTGNIEDYNNVEVVPYGV